MRWMMDLTKKAFETYCSIQRTFNLNWLPPVIIWDITYRCNQRCKFCFFYGPNGKLPNFDKELTLEEIDVMLQNLKKSYKFYKPHIGITGGEPTCRTDIKDILLLFKKYGFKYTLLTNGLHVSEETLSMLKDTGCKKVQFSVHGKEEIHDVLTGVKGSFNETFKSVLSAKLKGLNVRVNCVISESNISELSSLKKEFEDIPFRLQHIQWTTKDLQKKQLEYTKQMFGSSYPIVQSVPSECSTLSDEKLLELDNLLSGESFHQMPRNIKDVNKYYKTQELFVSRCLWVFGSARIDPYGNVYPCVDYYFGNLLLVKFKDLWKGKNARYFRKTIKKSLMPGCARCCKL